MNAGALDSSPATRMCLPGPLLVQCVVAPLPAFILQPLHTANCTSSASRHHFVIISVEFIAWHRNIVPVDA
jgi:hypothetical protein